MLNGLEATRGNDLAWEGVGHANFPKSWVQPRCLLNSLRSSAHNLISSVMEDCHKNKMFTNSGLTQHARESKSMNSRL